MKDWSSGEDPLLFVFKCQIIKYIKREKHKGQLEDIYKAEFFMKELVQAAEELYGKN